MSYEPVIAREIGNQILDYVYSTYSTQVGAEMALVQFRTALNRLAASPKAATSPPGLFETRPIFQFTLDVEGTPREVRLSFCYDAEDKAEARLLIIGFLVIKD